MRRAWEEPVKRTRSRGHKNIDGGISLMCKMIWREEVWWRKMPLIEDTGEDASGNELPKVEKNVKKKKLF